MIVYSDNIEKKGIPLIFQKKGSEVDLNPRDFNKSSDPKSLKGKVSLLKEFAPVVMKGVVKTAVAAAVLLGLAIVFIPVLIPLLVIGILTCFLATPFIMMEETAKRRGV